MTSKKRNMYLGVIGVGLLGLVIDRLASEPAPAAADAPSAPARKPALADASTPGAILGVTVEPFPGPLMLPLVADGARDPFAPTEAALPPPVEIEPDGPNAAPPAPDRVAEAAAEARRQFAQQHTLSAVVRFGDAHLAVIDGFSMSVGQALDDCVLRTVQPRTVEFACPGGAVVLSLEGDPVIDPVD